MTTEEHIRALREALAAGPTPGPWKPHFEEAYFVTGPDLGRVAMMMNLKGAHGLGGRRSGGESAANCRLIAANPAAILAVLDALEAAQMDAERLRVALLQAAAANAWQNFGESRAFHSFGHQERISTPDEIDALARAALTPGA